MTIILWTTLVVVLLIASVVAHEAAHAVALRRLRIPIVEAGLGLPLPPRLVLRPSRWIPFQLSLSPWLVGAYVQPDPRREKDLNALPYRDQAWYAGAGVITNLVIAGVVLTVLLASEDRYLRAVLFGVGTVVVWFARRAITAYVLPVAGVAALVFLGWILVTSVGEPQTFIAGSDVLVASTWHTALIVTGALNLMLGVLNMIPIFPFDGGRIADAVFRALNWQRVAAGFRVVTGVLAAGLLVYAVVGDLILLVLW